MIPKIELNCGWFSMPKQFICFENATYYTYVNRFNEIDECVHCNRILYAFIN